MWQASGLRTGAGGGQYPMVVMKLEVKESSEKRSSRQLLPTPAGRAQGLGSASGAVLLGPAGAQAWPNWPGGGSRLHQRACGLALGVEKGWVLSTVPNQ